MSLALKNVYLRSFVISYDTAESVLFLLIALRQRRKNNDTFVGQALYVVKMYIYKLILYNNHLEQKIK